MADESDRLLNQALDWAQRNRWVRQAAAGLLALALVVVAGNFVYQLLPRHYQLTISGGEFVSNRHQLARILQDEGHHHGLDLKVEPTYGTLDALARVSKGEIDAALVVVGGYDDTFDDIVHVSNVSPELLHALVRPEIQAVKDIRGKVVNLGPPKGALRSIGLTVLKFSGFEAGVDYFATTMDAEELITTRSDKLPDVVLDNSLLPSYIAEFMVTERGYRLLELPFPNSLALRMGWVAQGTIPGYTYRIEPAVPPADITTVGVRLHLVANRHVDSHAIFQLLETLYSPNVAARARITIDEARINEAAAYPISAGTVAYIDRNDPLLSSKTLDKLKNWFGLVMSVMSTVLVVYKWFKGPPAKPEEPETDDAFYRDRIKDVALIEVEARDAATGDRLDASLLHQLGDRLSAIRQAALDHFPEAKLADPNLITVLLLSVEGAQGRLALLNRRLGPG